MGRVLGWIGGVFTIAYLCGIAWLIKVRFDDLDALKLNEVGDFLAGAFGPLAILWLVLGYFQQGIELRQNSKALHMQAEELANSVAQQAELVAVSKDQLEHERDIFNNQLEESRKAAEIQSARMRPNFRLTYIRTGRHVEDYLVVHSFNLVNTGNKCTDIHLTLNANNSILTVTHINELDKMNETKLNFRTRRLNEENSTLQIRCNDGFGDEYVQEFSLQITERDVQVIS